MRAVGRKNTRKLTLAAVLATAAPAAALPPPPPIEVVAVSEDARAEGLAEAYVALLAHRSTFARKPGTVSTSRLRACMKSATGAEVCVRNELANSGSTPSAGSEVKSYDTTAAAVALLVSGGEDGIQDWTCVGQGRRPPAPNRQRITLNLAQAFFGNADQRSEQLQRAYGCVLAAAGESGW